MAKVPDRQLSRARPGEVVSIQGLTIAPLSKTSSSAGQLIYSDNPEGFGTISDTALTLLCQNVVQAGESRLFLYHLSQANRRAKVSVILEPVNGPASVIITRRGLATPSTDYGGIGIRVQDAWFRSQVAIARPVPGPAVLDPQLEEWSGDRGALFHAIYTFQSDQPLRVTVAALPAEAGSEGLYGRYLLIPREPLFSGCPEDFRARGVYLAAKDLFTSYDTGLGSRSLPVGHFFCTGPSPTEDGPTYDGWVPGSDQTPRPPGDTADLGPYLPGNYGVRYRIMPQLTGSQQVAVLLNGLGPNIQGAFQASPGITPGGVTAFGPLFDTGKAVLIAKYAPPALPELQVMPSGNSSLPWRVLLVPYRQR